LVGLAGLGVALENPVWRFETMTGKNNAVMVDIYLNEAKRIKLGRVITEKSYIFSHF